MAVDSGYATQEVYNWVRQHPQAIWGGGGARANQPRTVVAVKGRDRDTALILSASKTELSGRRRRSLTRMECLQLGCKSRIVSLVKVGKISRCRYR